MPRSTDIMPDDDSTLPGNKQEAAHTAHTDAKIVANGTIPCATCDERPPRPGRLRCQECLDAEWLRRQRKAHGHGTTAAH
jgi:hypothetical protein